MQLPELLRALRHLGLSGMAASLEARLVQAQADQLAPADFLALLLQDELTRRADRLLARRLKEAQFRDPDKTLDGFDFDFNKKMDRRLVFDLATGRFVTQREDVVCLGPAVGALLDRLLHHAHVLRCGPRSWRMKGVMVGRTHLPRSTEAGTFGFPHLRKEAGVSSPCRETTLEARLAEQLGLAQRVDYGYDRVRGQCAHDRTRSSRRLITSVDTSAWMPATRHSFTTDVSRIHLIYLEPLLVRRRGTEVADTLGTGSTAHTREEV